MALVVLVPYFCCVIPFPNIRHCQLPIMLPLGMDFVQLCPAFQSQVTSLGMAVTTPSKPAIYNIFSNKVDKFGDAWDRDPNRMNTHLQVSLFL